MSYFSLFEGTIKPHRFILAALMLLEWGSKLQTNSADIKQHYTILLGCGEPDSEPPTHSGKPNVKNPGFIQSVKKLIV